MDIFSLVSSVRKQWLRLVGPAQEFPLENRVFNSACVAALAAFVYSIAFNFIVGLIVPALISLFLFAVFFVIFYLSRYQKKMHAGLAVAAVTINFVFVGNYFYNSGIEGPTLLLFLVSFFIIIAVSPPSQYPWWFFLNLVTVFVLLALEYHAPFLVPETYSKRIYLFADFASSYFAGISLIYLCTWYIRKEYRAEKISAEQKALALEYLDSEKNKLFSIISHDLRTPLSSVQNYLEILNEVTLDEQERSKIQTELLRATQNTQEMLYNILSWAKKQLKGITPLVEKVNLSATVESTIDIYRSLAAKKNVRFSAQIPPSFYVYADKDMLQLIMRNLLSNAVKFTSAGDSILVTSKMEGERCILSVDDTGPGIPFKKQKDLFTLKVQSTFGTNNEKGVGLGLLLCKEYTEKQNGNLWFESAPGKGSSFHLSLPSGVRPEGPAS